MKNSQLRRVRRMKTKGEILKKIEELKKKREDGSHDTHEWEKLLSKEVALLWVLGEYKLL